MAVQELEIDALIRAGIFHSRGEAVEEAVRMLFVTRPQLRVEAAVRLYKEGAVTLGRAAEIAGLGRWDMEMLLADRGITRVVTADSPQDLDRQVERLGQKE